MKMNPDLKLRRKWTLRAHGRQMVFLKKPFESDIHVFSKAFIWALFLPAYPNLCVEIQAGGRYKPDVVQFDDNGEPIFWAEAGQVGRRKIRALVQRYRSAHLVFAKWNQDLMPLHRILKKELGAVQRRAPIDLISFPAESDERFIKADGTIQISFSDIRNIRC
jgi:hypothetical protein